MSGEESARNTSVPVRHYYLKLRAAEVIHGIRPAALIYKRDAGHNDILQSFKYK